MKNYLQLLIFSLAIGLLSTYIAGVAVTRSFNIPTLQSLKTEVNQQGGMKALSQQLIQRQKILLRQRREEFQYTMHIQKQKMQESLRRFKQRF